MFAFALSLLVEVAFNSGVGWGQIASDDVRGEAWPSCEDVALDCVEESARTGTEGGCMKPLDQLLLCLRSKECVGIVLGSVMLERETPKAVWEMRSGEYGLIVTVDGDGVFVEGCRTVVVA